MIVALLAREVVSDALRDRWLHVGPAAVLVLGPLTAGAARLALGAGDKAGADVGLFATWLLACGLALALGARALGPRDDLVWLYVRPISRARLVLARALGVAAALALQVLALSASFALGAVFASVTVPSGLWAIAGLLWVEACLLALLSGVLAHLLPMVPAALAAVGLWFVGHLADEARLLVARGDAPAAWAEIAFRLVPDLDALDVQAAVVHGVGPSAGEVAIATAYGGLWCAALALVLVALVVRRDLP